MKSFIEYTCNNNTFNEIIYNPAHKVQSTHLKSIVESHDPVSCTHLCFQTAVKGSYVEDRRNILMLPPYLK